MKTILTALLFASSLSPALAKTHDCTVAIHRDPVNPDLEAAVGPGLRQALRQKGFILVDEADGATFRLLRWKQCQQGPSLSTYCELELNLDSPAGGVYSNTIGTYDVWERTTHKHRQTSAFRAADFYCEDGVIHHGQH